MLVDAVAGIRALHHLIDTSTITWDFCSLGCFEARCSPIFNGKMCTSHDLEECCLAQCTFNQLGSARATYVIQEIAHIALGSSSTCAEERLTTIPNYGYSRNEVVANPVGNTCPVKGTCDLYQCANVIEQSDNHVFVNEDYVTTVTRSQSLSVSSSSNHPVQSSPSTKRTSTNLPTNSPSDTQSAYLATVSHKKLIVLHLQKHHLPISRRWKS